MLRKNWKIISLIVIASVGSTAGVVEYRRVTVLKDRLGCAATWLEKAKSLHMVQMNEPSNFTGDTMRKLGVGRRGQAEPRNRIHESPGGGSFGQHMHHK
jgi:hypothetical protein